MTSRSRRKSALHKQAMQARAFDECEGRTKFAPPGEPQPYQRHMRKADNWERHLDGEIHHGR